MRRAECHRLVVALIIVCAVAALFSAEHSTRTYRRSAEQPSIRNDVALPIPALPRSPMPLPIPEPLPPPSITVSSPHRLPAQQLAAAAASRPAHCPPCPAADGLGTPIDGFQPSSATELPAIRAEHGAVGGVELWQQRPAQVGDACRCRISLPGSLDAPDLRESRVLAWLKRADSLVVAREASLPRGRRANDPERAVPQPKGAAASSARCRTFVVSGKRRDLNESVRKAAVRLGMCEYGSRQGNWFDFELRDPPDEEDTPKRFVRRKRGCISGYIPGLREALGTKTALARLRAECEGCVFLPPSFEFKWTEDAAGLHGPHAALRSLSLAQASYPQLLTAFCSLLTAYCVLLDCLLLTTYGSTTQADYPQLWVLKTHDGFSQHEMKLVQVDAADASSDAALDGWLRATVPTKASISPNPKPTLTLALASALAPTLSLTLTLTLTRPACRAATRGCLAKRGGAR